MSTDEHRAAFLARNNGGMVSYRSVVQHLGCAGKLQVRAQIKAPSLLIFLGFIPDNVDDFFMSILLGADMRLPL